MVPDNGTLKTQGDEKEGSKINTECMLSGCRTRFNVFVAKIK